MTRRWIPGLLIALLAQTHASAQQDPRSSLRFDAGEAVALTAGAQDEAPAREETTFEGISDIPFGDASDQWWITVGGAGGVIAGRDDVFSQGFISASRFIADEFELAFEGGLWYLDQPDVEDALGVSASMIFRWHFLMDEEDRDWTVFASLGIGALLTDEDVSGDGSEFNFLPRAGLGFTHRIGDSRNRILTGLRWQHISNARLAGGDDNAGRDFVSLYVGLMFPF